MTKKKDVGLPLNTIVTVVARKGDQVKIKDMEYGKALELLKRKTKFNYTFYQQGYCAEKEH